MSKITSVSILRPTLFTLLLIQCFNIQSKINNTQFSELIQLPHHENCTSVKAFLDHGSSLCRESQLTVIPADYMQTIRIFCESLAPGFTFTKLQFEERLKQQTELNQVQKENLEVCRLLLNKNPRDLSHHDKTLSQRLNSELMPHFKPLIINKYYQKLHLAELPAMLILGTSSTLLDIENIKAEENNIIPIDKIILDQEFVRCLKNQNNCFNVKDFKRYNLLLNRLFHTNLDWDCQITPDLIQNLTSVSIVNSSSHNKRILLPTNHLYCEKNNNYARFTVNSISGDIIGSIQKLKTPFNFIQNKPVFSPIKPSPKNITTIDAWTNSPLGIKTKLSVNTCNNLLQGIDEPCILESPNNLSHELNTYAHLDRFQSLLPSFSINNESYILPLEPTKIVFNQACKKQNNSGPIGTLLASADPSSNTLCLASENNKYAGSDSGILVHEFSHLIAPDMFALTQSRQVTEGRFLFHDFADALSHAYTSDNCFAQYFHRNFKCEDKGPKALPREINQLDSLLSNIPLMDEEYLRGQIVARLFHIAKTTVHNHRKHSKTFPHNNIISTIIHWNILTKTLATVNLQPHVCLNCDISYYHILKTTQQSYLYQLSLTHDETIIKELKFAWAKEGFISRSSACLTDSNDLLYDCLNYKFENHKIVKSNDQGMAVTKLTFNNSHKISFQLISGVNYKFNSNNKLSITKNGCNQTLELFVSTKNSCSNKSECTVIKPLNIKTLDERICLFEVTVNKSNSNYDDFIKNNPNKTIFYSMGSYSNSEDTYSSDKLHMTKIKTL